MSPSHRVDRRKLLKGALGLGGAALLGGGIVRPRLVHAQRGSYTDRYPDWNLDTTLRKVEVLDAYPNANQFGFLPTERPTTLPQGHIYSYLSGNTWQKDGQGNITWPNMRGWRYSRFEKITGAANGMAPPPTYTIPLSTDYPYGSDGPPLAEVSQELAEIPETDIPLPISSDDLSARWYFPPQVRFANAPLGTNVYTIVDAVWTGNIHVVPNVAKNQSPPNPLAAIGWDPDGRFKSFKYIASNPDSKWKIDTKDTFIAFGTAGNAVVIGYPLLCLRLDVSTTERIKNPYSFYESFCAYTPGSLSTGANALIDFLSDFGTCTQANADTLRNGFSIYPTYQVVRTFNWTGNDPWFAAPAYK